MAMVTIEGTFMDAQVRTNTFDGVAKTALHVDIYQKESTLANKLVQLKTDDVSLVNILNKDFTEGSAIKVKASVNAYKNQAYFKLLEVATPALSK